MAFSADSKNTVKVMVLNLRLRNSAGNPSKSTVRVLMKPLDRHFNDEGEPINLTINRILRKPSMKRRVDETPRLKL